MPLTFSDGDGWFRVAARSAVDVDRVTVWDVHVGLAQDYLWRRADFQDGTSAAGARNVSRRTDVFSFIVYFDPVKPVKTNWW